MLRIEWNALRPGDRVCVHDDASEELTLRDGEVVVVQSAPDTNDVGIEIARNGAPGTVVRPRLRAVHAWPLDAKGRCWRCDAIAARRRGSVATPILHDDLVGVLTRSS